jgi:hypothetical protein
MDRNHRGKDCGSSVPGLGFDQDCASLDANFGELLADDEAEFCRRDDDRCGKAIARKALCRCLEEA